MAKPIYVISPQLRDFVNRWDDWDEDGSARTVTVHEHDDSPRDTGLLDPSGNKLFRIPQKRHIGFRQKD